MAMVNTDVSLPAQSAAGATSETVVAVIPSTFTTAQFNDARMSLTSPSLVTGAATNNVTYNVRQYHNGTLVTTPASGIIGSLQLVSGTNLPAFTEVVIPVNTGTNFVPGDVVTVQMVQNGTGLASPANVLVKIEFE
jgi:hypothetical protein